MKRIMPEALRFQATASCAAIVGLMIAGISLWARLPEELPIHFNFQYVPDMFAPKSFVVFGMPIILLASQFLCIYASATLPSGTQIPPIVILWIVPAVGLCIFVLLYATGLGKQPDVGLWIQGTLGVVLILLGNAMPKSAAEIRLGRDKDLSAQCKQRIARFWGYCLVFGGIAMCVSGLAGGRLIFFAIVFVTWFAPILYTFCVKDVDRD